jgi:nicotinate-nucleotide--dimethylbenzimidazole phosphoribosyltransferase
MTLLSETISKISPCDKAYRQRATNYIETLTMPHWALGMILDLAVDLCGMTSSMQPPVKNKRLVVFAGDHGVVHDGVSQQPQAVTSQMMVNFANGGAGVNIMSRNSGAEVTVVDMGAVNPIPEYYANGKILDRRIAPGTASLMRGPAMSREQAIQSIEAGIQIALDFGEETDIFGAGEMGIGNTTPSTAIVAVLTGKTVAELTGRGAGLPEDMLPHKVKVIETALEVNQPDPEDGLDILTKVGGFEIGAIAGLILGAAVQHKPMVIDGFISSAGALIAQALCPACTDYMIAAHKSQEPGHKAMLEKLGKEGLLDLNLRLGEGSGAALAMHLTDAAYRVMTEMATFEKAAVAAEGINKF